MMLPHLNRPRLAVPPRALVAPVLFALLSTTAGCAWTTNDFVRLPTLREVEPLSPAGRRCYDTCAHQEASCIHMCPQFGQLCHDDCEMDTKFCLQDCPDLRRPSDPAK